MANKYQPIADKMNKRVVAVYHTALELHKAACESQCAKAHEITANLIKMALDMKVAGLELNGCMDESTADPSLTPDGGVSVQSGGT